MGDVDHRSRLTALREEVRRALVQHDLAADGSEASDGHHHPAEAATDSELREHDLREHLRLRQQEARLTASLEAVDAGTYGVCQDCGGPIPEGRMMRVPDAVRCVPCQSKADRRR
ncbi:MAG: TraR/DksA C4-type zinc finger protein [Miltoncostaeaceae bacterium]